MREPDECESMAEVRAELDVLDREIVTLLARRFRYVDAAARIKQRRDQVRDENRISAVIEQVRSAATAERAPADLIAELYRKLIELSINRELEKFDAGAS